jgi:hypothetical protein
MMGPRLPVCYFFFIYLAGGDSRNGRIRGDLRNSGLCCLNA